MSHLELTITILVIFIAFMYIFNVLTQSFVIPKTPMIPPFLINIF